MGNGLNQCETVVQNPGVGSGVVNSCTLPGRDLKTARVYSNHLREEFDQAHRVAMAKFNQYAKGPDAFFTLGEIGKRRHKTVQQVIVDQLDKKMVSIATMPPGAKRVDEVRDALVYLAMLNVYERGRAGSDDYLPPWACKDCG